MYWNPSFHGNCLCALTRPQHHPLIAYRGCGCGTSPHSYNLNCVNQKSYLTSLQILFFNYTDAVCIFKENFLHPSHMIWTGLIIKYMHMFQSSLLSLCIRISISVHLELPFLACVDSGEFWAHTGYVILITAVLLS